MAGRPIKSHWCAASSIRAMPETEILFSSDVGNYADVYAFTPYVFISLTLSLGSVAFRSDILLR